MSGNIDEKQVIVGEASVPAPIDKSLKKAGFAADAAEVGRRFEVFGKRLDELNPVTAEGLEYDGSASGLDAANVQSALDEMAGKVTDSVGKVDKDLEEALAKIDGKMESYLKAEDKPSGTYTGNGSSAQRVIDIGGKGNVLLVYANGSNTSERSAVFVLPIGAYGHSGTNGGVSYAGSSAAKFENGKLTLATTSFTLNQKDVEYYYQVL